MEDEEGFSRRAFLAALAAVPLAAGGPLFAASKPRIAVIGAGAFGGWTALQLRRLGADVLLVDRWGPGNARSSSGGKTRVIRAVYGPDRIYSEMVRRAFESWRELAAASRERLYVPTGVLWMHRQDDAYVRAAAPILHDLGFPIDQLTLREAARRYPQIDFRNVRSVWFEKEAGALTSRAACRAVAERFEAEGGTYRTAVVKPLPTRQGTMRRIETEDGRPIEADVFVFACGPWLGEMFPEVIGERVHPTRQEVFYFGIPAGSDFLPERLPIWIDFGERIVYGIPGVDARWFKVADDTRGGPIDPTNDRRTPSPEGIARARAFLRERFPRLASEKLMASEVCQYENSPDGNLIIDRHPEASNVWIVGGGSGHGFKLSPVVGQMAAQAVLRGQAIPAMFRLDRLRNFAKPKTQFETSLEMADPMAWA